MKKKGFTLVELLAVIVILAVIALITVPMLLNVAEKSRKESFKDGVLNAFNAVEYYLLKNNLSSVPTQGINVTDLELKNGNFDSGTFVKNSDGKMEAFNITDGRYCANGKMTELVVTKGECDSSTTETITKPSIAQYSAFGNTSYGYARYRNIRITYSSDNIESPLYYFKSSVTATVESGIITGECGVDSNPGECSAADVTTMVAGTWYQTTMATPIVKFEEEGILYALMSDGTNMSELATYEILNLDTEQPTVDASVDETTVTITMTDNVGIVQYGIMGPNDTSYTFTNIDQTPSNTITYEAQEAGTYKVIVFDVTSYGKSIEFTIVKETTWDEVKAGANENKAYSTTVTYDIPSSEYNTLTVGTLGAGRYNSGSATGTIYGIDSAGNSTVIYTLTFAAPSDGVVTNTPGSFDISNYAQIKFFVSGTSGWYWGYTYFQDIVISTGV